MRDTIKAALVGLLLACAACQSMGRGIVLCLADINCEPPHTICVSETCVPGCQTTGCGTGMSCNNQTGRCLDESITCTIDGQCNPPGGICENTHCVPGCPTTGCGTGQTCNNQTGRCINGSGSCSNDAGCAPPNTICIAPSCVPGCLTTGCGSGLTCNSQTGRCEAAATCSHDGQCNPPSTICTLPNCVPGCLTTGCGAGLTCNNQTGRCENSPAGNLGQECNSDANCDSRICIPIGVGGTSYQVCMKPCCSTSDCPSGFGCIYYAGLRFCIPSRIFPVGYTFNDPPYATCNTGGTCKSGSCDSQKSWCLETCCTDSDCGGKICVWTENAYDYSIRNYCDQCIPGIQNCLIYGQSCTSNWDCSSGICAAGPSGAHCAKHCCRTADCPAGTVCNQIGAQSGGASTQFVLGCVPLSTGTWSIGTSCNETNWSQCWSGLCHDGKCTDTCCSNNDCPNGYRCNPVSNDAQGLIPVCVANQ